MDSATIANDFTPRSASEIARNPSSTKPQRSKSTQIPVPKTYSLRFNPRLHDRPPPRETLNGPNIIRTRRRQAQDRQQPEDDAERQRDRPL